MTRFALGIDTGGTYTDAVLYEDAADRLVVKAKAPTTHDDLAIGIAAAIDRVLGAGGDAPVDPVSIEMVSLSTTLATNALVEGTGRPACLVMIGFDETTIDRGGLREAVGTDAVIAVAGGHSSHGDEIEPLDLEALASGIDGVAGRVDGFAIMAQFATRNADHELAARDLIRERTGKPVTCSHRLSARLNGPKRGVTALLNARLISMIEELVATTARLLEDRGIDAPMMIVRGNGSLVSADFVRDRPVETILSGPAASLIGAGHLADAPDAIISDIGGTTTDIAVLRSGEPEIDPDGADVGGHLTMVEAVRMHTHGLGGDSRLELADRAVGAELEVGPRRVVPLCLAADDDRATVVAVLDRQLAQETPGAYDGQLVRRTARAEGAVLDRNELQVLEAMGDRLVAVDEVVASAVQERALQRLIRRALVRLTAFTPTDASHVLGRQATNDVDVARLGAELFARRRDRYGDAIAESAEEISELTTTTLVRRSSEALLAAAFERDGLSAEAAASELVAAALDGTATSSRIDIGLGVPLIGLGAPASTYYPAIGELLRVEVRVPEHADVANAIGAVVGRVRVRHEITVTAPRRGVYRIHAGTQPETQWERPDARDRAIELAEAAASEAVVAAGAGEFTIDTTWAEKTIEVEGRPMFVEGRATAVAAGRPRLD